MDPQTRYRRLFYWSSLVNSLSFNLMMGNLVTLFLLRIDTSKSMMGLISAFPWLSLLFAGMGKAMIRRYGVIRTISWIWKIRALLLLPQALAPVLILLGVHRNSVIILFVITQLLFQILRGMGLAGNTPLFAKLASEKQRTGFFINMQVANNIGSLLIVLLSSWLLAHEGLWIYSVFYALGIGLGLVTGQMYGLQEEIVPNEKPEKQRGGLLRTLIAFFRYRESRLFAISALFSYGLCAVANVFLIVYFKEAYAIDESKVMLYSLGGPIAIVVFGLVARPLLNRMGPKPVCVLTSFALACGVAALIIDVREAEWLHLWIFSLNVIVVISTVGLQDALQAYFLNHLNDRNDLNKGLVINLIRGLSGVAAIFAGVFLDQLKAWPVLGISSQANSFVIFQIFWLFFLLMILVNLILLLCLKRGSAMRLSQSIAVFCSPRAWQGVWQLELSQKGGTAQQQQELLSDIKTGPASPLLLHELPNLLQAPNLLLRLEALESLRNPQLEITDEIKDLLIEHVTFSPYTTGANAANILGQRAVKGAIPVLRTALDSADYNLKAQAILALGRLDDRGSLDEVRLILLKERENQRICIYAINSIKLLGSPQCDVPLLLRCLENWQASRRMNEEVTLALSTLFGVERDFYREYCAFLDEPQNCWQRKLEQLERKCPQKDQSAKNLQSRDLSLSSFVPNEMTAQTGEVSAELSRLARQLWPQPEPREESSKDAALQWLLSEPHPFGQTASGVYLKVFVLCQFSPNKANI